MNPNGRVWLTRWTVLMSVALLVGCGQQNPLSLPSSVKSVNGDIVIPFPYGETPHGEVWTLDRNTSGHLVLEVQNRDRTVAEFDFGKSLGVFYVDKLGKQLVGGHRYQTSGAIQLGNTVYTVTEIDLNTDNQSGKVILKAQ